MNWIATNALVLVGAALGGCAVGPDYDGPPKVIDLDRYAAAAGDPDALAGVDGRALSQWWRQFDDPTLAALIDQALAQNLDLEAAAARVAQSRSMLRQAGAELLPSAATSAQATRSRRSETASGITQAVGGGVGGGVGAGDVAGAGPVINFGDLTTNFYSLDLQASWEIDFFGGRRRAIQQRVAALQSAAADAVSVRLSVTGEVADAYVSLVFARTLLDVAQANVSDLAETLALASRRFEAGLVGELDVLQARADLDDARSRLPARRADVALQQNRLAVVLGLTPAEAAGVIAALPAGREPTLPPAPGIGLPSSLLRRRPDVIVAERRLAAATAGVGVQIAEYFPKLNLLGSAGLQSDELNDLIDAGSRTWSFGGAIDWRLLDFARINAAVGLARAQVAEETANYKSSVVSAVRDVEDALVRLRAADEQTAALTTALNSRQSSVDQVERQYEAGLTQFLPVLTERRSLNAARTDLATARRDRLLAAVSLFRALGGGWPAPGSSPSI